ncbi:MAG: amino acid adenylation domain-containing protein [Marinobacterium sp.]|nr:amino acid adenylation domain-containing protein [Marinobacterium sp.]
MTSVRTLPLLPGQQGIWLADQLCDSKDVYTIAHCVELPDTLDTGLLRQAIRQGITEADTVTARYSASEQGGVQQLQRLTLGQIPQPRCHDWRQRDDGMALAWQQMWQDCQAALDLSNAEPGYLHQLYRVHNGEGEARLLWYQRYHHIMLDGFSFAALTRRIAAIYNALATDSSTGDTPFISVEAVLDEQQQWAQSSSGEKAAAFWQQYASTLPAPSSLSRHGPQQGLATAKLRQQQWALPSSTLNQLQQALPADSKMAAPDLLMALMLGYLARMTGQYHQAVGVPFMGRMGSVAINSVAPVVNVLPVAVELNPQLDWPQLAALLRSELRKVRRHQRYPAEQILRNSQRLGSGEGLYGAVINYKLFDYQLDFAGHSGQTHHLATGPIDDFEFGLVIQDEQISIELRADAERYSRQELALHQRRLQQMLNSWLANPATPLAQLELMDAEEQADIRQWSQGRVFDRHRVFTLPDAQPFNCIVDLLQYQASVKPQQRALLCAETEVNFAELACQVNQLTRLLIARGAGPGNAVAVAMPRSTRSVVAMLAVLNSGAAFLPLDLDYPADRMAMMCEDVRPLWLLSEQGVEVAVPDNIPRIDLNDSALTAQLQPLASGPVGNHERNAALLADSVAYIIFTSGSTGRPKGVMNSHGALANLISSHNHSFYGPALAEQQRRWPERPLRAAHTHSFSFDSSWLQIFWLLQGQELYVFDEEMRRDAWALVQAVDELKIDAMDLPPSLLSQMFSNGLMAEGSHQPTLLLIGGEAAPAALWQQLRSYPELQSHNLYGPTEYTVDTLRAAPPAHEQPLVGRPIGNTCAHVLDAQLQPVPIGVAGELYIAGDGLAEGYLARGGLSASRFVANPFSQQPGQRMYRSGDLVRWTLDGQLEFLGRGDDQVKIRGYRVELGEVENALSLLPGVESAVVVAQPVNNSHRLVGYVVLPDLVTAEAPSRNQALMRQLRETLPDYMVPAVLMLLDSFPRNVSGKVDRRALPEPSVQVSSSQPASAEERQVCSAMAAVLQLEQLGVEDDFFSLGGDSISAIMLCTRLREQGYSLRPSEVFAQRTPRLIASTMQVLHLQQTVQHLQQTAQPPWQLPAQQQAMLRARHGSGYQPAPLLPLQQGMLFQTLLDENSASYNTFTRLEFHGALAPQQLQQALNRVLQRYPQLAGFFDLDSADQPLLMVPDSSVHTLSWPLQLHRLSRDSGMSGDNGKEADENTRQVLEQQLLQQPGVVTRQSGMINAALIELAPQRWQLLLMVHHLVVDGWSTPLLLGDLMQALASDKQLPPLDVSYSDLMQQLSLRDRNAAQQLWQQQMAGAQPTLLFADEEPSEETDRDKTTDIPAEVTEYALTLDAELQQQLNSALRERGCTLNVMMQAVWALVLSGMTGRDDLVFGSPVSGRSAAISGIESQVGLFLNTLPVRVQLDNRQDFWSLLPEMQQRHIEQQEHDSLGLADIQQLAGTGTLFDTLLVVENYPDNSYLNQSLTGSDGQPLQVCDIHNRGYSHYPLALLALPGEQLTLLVESRLPFSHSLNPQWVAQRVERILRTALTRPELPLAQYPLLSEPEQQQLDAINATAHPVVAETLRDALQAQAARSPDAPALRDDQHQLSYRQVRGQVNAMAARLIAGGVKPGSIVAVALPRSVQLSLALLSIIEAGGAYLPLDTSYPDDRLACMLEDAAPPLLITLSDEAERFSSMTNAPELLLFDQLLEPLAEPPTLPALSGDHPAYVIFTSGTTGRPKGTMVSHRAIVNRIEWMQAEYPMNNQDRVLQKTPCSFDVSVWEFFWSYMVGAELVMAAPDAHKDPQALVEIIERTGISCMHFVPSMLAIFTANARSLYPAEQAVCPTLRQVFCSGEALTKAQARAFASRFSAKLHNLYGPTEAAVDVSYRPAFGELSSGGAGVPIGKPVWNTQLRVLDHCLREVPIGATGELYLGGIQLAMGYLGRPGLTAGRFIADPYSNDGGRLYRTGDMVRWLGEGEIEYLGRADDQIKIRGQRVELGEIETRLLAQPGVANVVVHAMELGQASDGEMDNRQLVAFLVPEGKQTPDQASIRAAMAEQLPAHMQPVAYGELSALPLSANGKLDRRALPQPQLASGNGDSSNGDSRNGSGQQRPLPTRGLESRLATLFAELLGIEQIYADDDFFALGGHSLLAMRLSAEIRTVLQRNVSVGQIMLAATVSKLAAVLNEDGMQNDFGSDGFAPVIQLREGEGTPLFCVYPGSGFAWQYSVLSRYLSAGQPIIGLQSPRPEGLIASSENMAELVQRQLEIIREVQPQGPYDLLGYSLGGTVAYGVACALRKAGQQVRFLGLLDTYPAEVHDWSDPQGAEAALGAEREQAQLLDDAFAGEPADTEASDTGQPGDLSANPEKDALLNQIFANYRDAVRLLSQARTPDFDGKITLFTAQQSLPDYIEPERSWQHHVDGIELHMLAHCAHEDIMSPQSLETLGPLLDRLLHQAQSAPASGVSTPADLATSEQAG